jgi:RecB family exonuclease
MSETITTWSYSRFSTYSNCPKKAKYLYIDKLKDVGSPALDHGSAVHKGLEDFLRYPGFDVPKGTHPKFVPMLENLLAQDAKPEESWAFTEEWKPCGPWDKNVWVRGKFDSYYITDDSTLIMIDFKTGQVRPMNQEQLELYALMGFMKFPLVDKIITELWYVEEGTHLVMTYLRPELPGLLKRWNARCKPMMTDTTFRERPSALCGYCNFAKGGGGPCKF